LSVLPGPTTMISLIRPAGTMKVEVEAFPVLQGVEGAVPDTTGRRLEGKVPDTFGRRLEGAVLDTTGRSQLPTRVIADHNS